MIQRLRFGHTVHLLFRAPRWMGENPFLGFLILLLFALLISSAVFYRYVFVVRDVDVESEITQTRFDQQAFQRLLRMWQERKEKFDQATVQVRNIFAPLQKTDNDLTKENSSL